MFKTTRSLAIVICVAIPLIASNVAASTPNALSILTKALRDGSRERSVTLSGAFTESGATVSLDGGFDAAANGGITTVPGVGSEDEVQPIGKNYCFVKATSIAALHNDLNVKKPTAAEVGVWYEVTSSDPRYVEIASPSAPQTVAQLFSFSPSAWKRSAVYEGATVLRGVHVIKLASASDLFVNGSGYAAMTLYVTDSSSPLPFAISGPTGTSGLAYFTRWGSTSVAIPNTSLKLPS